AYNPTAVSPAAEWPNAYNPTAVSPAAEWPNAYNPTAVSPAAEWPNAYNPTAVSPASEWPNAYHPTAVSPAAEWPNAYNPTAVSPASEWPNAYHPTAVGPVAEWPNAYHPTAVSPVAEWPNAQPSISPVSGKRGNDQGTAFNGSPPFSAPLLPHLTTSYPYGNQIATVSAYPGVGTLPFASFGAPESPVAPISPLVDEFTPKQQENKAKGSAKTSPPKSKARNRQKSAYAAINSLLNRNRRKASLSRVKRNSPWLSS
ncbi:hypothetical protein WMW72_26830, partial [Paenibacillus filicis]